MEYLWIEVLGCSKYSKVLIGVIYRLECIGLSLLDWLGVFEILLVYFIVFLDGLFLLIGDLNIDMLKF